MMSNFTEEQFNISFKKIWNDLTADIIKTEEPKVIFLAGQSGAGKSNCKKLYTEKFKSNIIVTDIDNYREEHPSYNELVKKYPKTWAEETQEFASKMGTAITDRLCKGHYNVIVDGTMKNIEKTKKLIEMFRKEGYKHIEVGVVATKPDISKVGIISRYANCLSSGMPARLVPFDLHDKIIEELPKNLNILSEERLVDKIRIYNRDNECIYDNEQKKNIKAGDKLKQVFNSQINEYEKSWINEKAKEIYPELEPTDEVTLNLLQTIKDIRKKINKPSISNEMYQLLPEKNNNNNKKLNIRKNNSNEIQKKELTANGNERDIE